MKTETKVFIKKQWSRKLAFGFIFWITGTVMFVLSVYKIFPTDINFKDWAAFTEWTASIMFVTHVGDKALAKPGGNLFDTPAAGDPNGVAPYKGN